MSLIFLAACSVVEVKIETIPTDEPQVSPSGQGFTAETAEDDDSMVIQTLAYPHLVFSPEGVKVELFEQEIHPQEYMIADAGYGYRLRTDWRAVWLAGSYGVGNITMEIYVQPPGGEYEYWQYASTEDMEEWGANFRDQLLDATILWPDSGLYNVRAELTVLARLEDGTEDRREMTYDTQVIVLSKPSDEPPTSIEYFQPSFGELESYNVLMDWRAWAYGPCAVGVDDQTLTHLLDKACLAVEAGDWATAAAHIQESLALSSENPVLLGTLRNQLGMLAAVQGQWNIAARHFREALNMGLVQNDALNVAIALHNLGNSVILAGRWAEGEQELSQSGQLQGQMGDWVGAMFTWSQLGLYWDSVELVQYNREQMSNIGLPQVEVLQNWLAEKEATPTSEEQ